MSTGNLNLDPAKATNSAERTILVVNEKMKNAQPLTEAEAAFMFHFASNNDKLTAQLKQYIAAYPPTAAAAASSGAAVPATSGAPTAQGDGIEWAITSPLPFLDDK
jgi:phosphoglycerate dehydrogenase-like enzyme